MRHAELLDELVTDEPEVEHLIQTAISYAKCTGSKGCGYTDDRVGRVDVERVARHPAAWRITAAPWHHAIGMVIITAGNPGQYHHYGRD